MVHRLLGNLTPKALFQALNSMPRLPTSPLKMRTNGRRSGISDGSGGKHNKMVLKKDLTSNTKNSE